MNAKDEKAPKEEQPKEAKQSGPEQIQTPPPPQVIDPSKSPGKGEYETYGNGEKDKVKRKE